MHEHLNESWMLPFTASQHAKLKIDTSCLTKSQIDVLTPIPLNPSQFEELRKFYASTFKRIGFVYNALPFRYAFLTHFKNQTWATFTKFHLEHYAEFLLLNFGIILPLSQWEPDKHANQFLEKNCKFFKKSEEKMWYDRVKVRCNGTAYGWKMKELMEDKEVK